jgi:AcrR family transcriptional regulator
MAVKRTYNAPRRAAAAAQTRSAILAAALARFETRGWAGTTIAAVAADSGVSPKTVEALFATKAGLLSEVVTFAIRGDAGGALMIERPAGRAVEEAPDASTMLARHAAYSAAIGRRAATITWVVEGAAAGDEAVAAVAARMRENRRFGARWAAEILVALPGVTVSLEEARRRFLFAIDPGVYRALTTELELAPDDVEAWLRDYYERTLLPA